MRIARRTLLPVLAAALLLTGGCDGEGARVERSDVPADGVAPEGDTATDVRADASAVDAPAGPDGGETCPPRVEERANEPCPGREGASCTSTFEWCGRQTVASGCDCADGVWRCWSAGAPAPCHTCCVEDHGEGWFCNPSGACVEAFRCLAIECCVPGAQGDEWCRANFGECSRCAPGEETGTCAPQTCE